MHQLPLGKQISYNAYSTMADLGFCKKGPHGEEMRREEMGLKSATQKTWFSGGAAVSSPAWSMQSPNKLKDFLHSSYFILFLLEL